MANNLNSNPLFVDTAATLWTESPKYVKLIQWVDDVGDMTDNDDCILTINGVALTGRIQRPTDVGFSHTVKWQIGPFNPGIPVSTFIVTTIDSGVIHIWLE